MNKIRVLVVDDHAIVRDGLRVIIDREKDLVVIDEAETGEEGISKALALRPHVLLVDLSMPGKSGVEVIAQVSESEPSIRMLVLTSYGDDRNVFSAIKAGAHGYLLKDTPAAQLIEAIRDVAQDKAVLHPLIAAKVLQEMQRPQGRPPTLSPLTPAEVETLRLIATRGLSNKELAAEQGVQERTICKRVASILSKLQLANRTQAALYAVRTGLVELDSEDV